MGSQRVRHDWATGTELNWTELNHKSKTYKDTHTHTHKERKDSKHNTKDSHQVPREESKRTIKII